MSAARIPGPGLERSLGWSTQGADGGLEAAGLGCPDSRGEDWGTGWVPGGRIAGGPVPGWEICFGRLREGSRP